MSTKPRVAVLNGTCLDVVEEMRGWIESQGVTLLADQSNRDLDAAGVVRMCGQAEAVIAHSMGAGATAFAMSKGFPVGRVVFVGSPLDPGEFFGRFMGFMGAPPSAVPAIARDIQERWGFHWSDLSIEAIGRTMSTPLLAIHDRADEECAFEGAVRVVAAWPGAKLIPTVGLGHHRILRDARVAKAAVDFIRGLPASISVESCRIPGCENPVEEKGHCWAHLLEDELFHRDSRGASREAAG